MSRSFEHLDRIPMVKLSLTQVFFRSIRLPQKEGNVLIGRINESLDGGHRLLEFLQELLMFLITPASAERIELSVHDGELVLHLRGESPQRGCESP